MADFSGAFWMERAIGASAGAAVSLDAVVTEMALAFSCSRVSLGFRRFGSTRVDAISHSSSFSRRVQLVQQIGRAMDEAIDQRALIRFPPAPESVTPTCWTAWASDRVSPWKTSWRKSSANSARPAPATKPVQSGPRP